MSNERKKPRGKAPVAPQNHVQIRNKTKNASAGKNGGEGAKKLRYSHLLDEMVGCGDMVLLEPLTEESLLENLKMRYDSGEIYTYIGPVVVSVNPYRQLPIYTPDYIEEYTSRNMYELPPHM
jgi:myosin heavy subunit